MPQAMSWQRATYTTKQISRKPPSFYLRTINFTNFAFASMPEPEI